ncbi:sigma-70 family RNA polymerase sigma factor [Luteolibacter sp. Populi]|uniref:sigma-70 family RNA polymerase sigma factor n=1 Tax=Luteolibacter sp. Populi TaxID=3230487 RepID=UPI00346565B7
MDPEKLGEIADGSDSASEIAAEIRLFQAGLKEYVAGLLGGADGVEDLVQETNLFLWEQRGEFVRGSNFRAWAKRVAWFKVMAERRDRLREGRVAFSESMLEQLASRAEERMPQSDLRLEALRRCLSRSRPQDRKILEWKYSRRASLTELADAHGCAPNAMHKMISRLRLALRHCVEKQLAEDLS